MRKARGVSFPKLTLYKLTHSGTWSNTNYFVNGKKVSIDEYNRADGENNTLQANHRIRTKKVVAKMINYLVNDKDVDECSLLRELLAKKGVDDNGEVDKIVNQFFDSVYQFVNRERIAKEVAEHKVMAERIGSSSRLSRNTDGAIIDEQHDEDCECAFCRFNRSIDEVPVACNSEEAGDVRLIRPSTLSRSPNYSLRIN